MYLYPHECFRGGFYSNPMKITKAELDLMNTMRMLWEQHGVWTRMAITSMVFGLPDEEMVVNRLLQNPVDFANTLKFFYGDEIASKFSDLLKSHLVIASQLVKAAKAGDNKSATEAEKKWYENADEIAVFLSYINPYWSRETWKAMLHEHLALVKAEAVAMLTKDYAAGIKVYDKIESQALEMADMMAEGIIKQFSY
ncbi:acetylglutamate kinase [Clostridium tagluense]|uniref:acetylglutamate kinase n=2 Tax=Clostridium tagluense TaxID=360422 RepID=UPI001CF1A9B2|nr:acetylglutamate kinase [Clostridium tagluense]MCB2314190.1 acetylglutamate kinase [Clostridium tagluense]MCB2319061.1 acetylglutamate kinase [Clostridium tagluense]MCB2328786.1 acetylglutamate kinase [Clostridium tagluense]MCB2333685.1 acetylglutamate kinase [Clostridium tagluense]WAG52241.1 acetylglutamate kinase [Clostridium tagluense]